MQIGNAPVFIFKPPFEWMEIEGDLYKKTSSGLWLRIGV
jgi:hypothetical protein